MLRRRSNGQHSFDARDAPSLLTCPQSSPPLIVFCGPYFKPPLRANHGREYGRAEAHGKSCSRSSLNATQLARLREPRVAHPAAEATEGSTDVSIRDLG